MKTNTKLIIVNLVLLVAVWAIYIGADVALATESVEEGLAWEHRLPADPRICTLDSVVCDTGRLPVAGIATNPVQIIRHLALKNDINYKKLLRIVDCESNFNPNVRGRVDNRDRGLWQFNSRWHPEVSDDCAFDSWCSTQKAIDLIKAGYAHHWVCNNNLGIF